MINIYLYDGSFDGLLTCIYEYYYSSVKPDSIINAANYIPNLINNTFEINTSEEKSQKVLKAIKDKIGNAALREIFTVYLSEEDDCENLILQYVRLGFKLGREIHNHLHNEIVLKVDKTCKRVEHEAHLFTGFVRFTLLKKDLYFASIEPDHNILTIIAPHFSSRFSDQSWIIHDVKREIAVMFDKNEWILLPLSKEKADKILNYSGNDLYETLWKSYYNNISIEERENPRLRTRLMPRRYWKHLLEIQDN